MRDYILLLISPVLLGSIGYILDILFYYYKHAIYEKYTDWWYSLSELSLTEINTVIIQSMLKIDALIFGKRLISLNSIAGVFILSWIYGWVANSLERGTHSLQFHYTSAWVFTLTMFPLLLVVVTITRLLIKLAAKCSTPLATGLTALVLFLGMLCFDLLGCRVIGSLLPWVPIFEYGHLSPQDQVYTFIFFYGMVTAICRLLFFIELTPFYFYLTVGCWIYVMYFFAKFFERYLAMHVDTSNFKFFSSAGALIGICGNVVIFVLFPLLVFLGEVIGDMESRAGTHGAQDTVVYLKSSIMDQGQKDNFVKASNLLLEITKVREHDPNGRLLNIRDGEIGQKVLYKLFTGQLPPDTE